MDTPVMYYGGKNRLIPEILPLIPPHRQYVEPFCGGASLLFAKTKSDNEVINDKNGLVVNFFRQCKTNFKELQEYIQRTPHSEAQHKLAKAIYESPDAYADVDKAWAFWMQCNLSFGHKPLGGFAFSEGGQGQATANKRDSFTEKYAERLREVEIFERDAVDLIALKDSPSTFFYIDPPYVSSDKGHYKDYTMEDFIRLLDALANINGKFLLSSYPEDVLLEYRDKYKWQSKDMKMVTQVTGKREVTKYKTECLTWNYELSQLKLI